MALGLRGGSKTPPAASGSGTEGQRLWGAFLGFTSEKMKERIFPLPSLHQKLGYGVINPSLSGTWGAALARGSPSIHQPWCPRSPGLLARQKQQLSGMGSAAPVAQYGKSGGAGWNRGRSSGWLVACSGVSAPHLSWTAPARHTLAPTVRGAAGPSQGG